MRLGVNLPNFGPGTGPEVLLRWAKTVEGLGYDLLLVSDHLAITEDVARLYPAPFYEPFSTLSWLAGVTSTIQLGTTVLLMPYRHPLLLARMIGNIDALSGGRLVLGVGAGWAEQEFAALGIPFAQRGAITDDYLAALRTLLDNDIASHDGPFASFRNVQTAPRPAAGCPPIWIGGNGRTALRRAIRFGDAWHPLRFGTIDNLRTGLANAKTIADELGRPVPALAPRIPLRLTETPATAPDRPVGIGTFEEIIRDLNDLRDLGAESVILDTTDTDDPDNTRRPEAAWRTLAAIIAAVNEG